MAYMVSVTPAKQLPNTTVIASQERRRMLSGVICHIKRELINPDNKLLGRWETSLQVAFPMSPDLKLFHSLRSQWDRTQITRLGLCCWGNLPFLCFRMRSMLKSRKLTVRAIVRSKGENHEYQPGLENEVENIYKRKICQQCTLKELCLVGNYLLPPDNRFSCIFHHRDF